MSVWWCDKCQGRFGPTSTCPICGESGKLQTAMSETTAEERSALVLWRVCSCEEYGYSSHPPDCPHEIAKRVVADLEAAEERCATYELEVRKRNLELVDAAVRQQAAEERAQKLEVENQSLRNKGKKLQSRLEGLWNLHRLK